MSLSVLPSVSLRSEQTSSYPEEAKVVSTTTTTTTATPTHTLIQTLSLCNFCSNRVYFQSRVGRRCQTVTSSVAKASVTGAAVEVRCQSSQLTGWGRRTHDCGETFSSPLWSYRSSRCSRQWRNVEVSKTISCYPIIFQPDVLLG